MLRFENIVFLYGLLLIPLLWGLFRLRLFLWKKQVGSFGDYHLIRSLIPAYSASRKSLRFWLLMMAFGMLMIALANPQTGSTLETVERKGIDIMIALDVSNSMLSEDIRPNRISRAKQAISRLIDKLSNDRIGMVVFAGKAYTQLPITTDYAAAKLFLNTINPDMIPIQGTAIGEAINLASSAFQDKETSKAIIIITDGENHEDDALQAAASAAESGIIVCTIGMGLPEGGPIPQYRGNTRTGFKKDASGATVVTRLDEVMLQQIAASGNGRYVRANNTDAGLEKIFETISKLEKTSFDAKVFADYEDRYQIFLVLAAFFLILEILIAERKSRWFGSFNLIKLDLFNKKGV